MEPFSLVYYVAFGDRIKIGTTTDLNQRLQSIPHDELLAFERGGRALERKRHRQFAADLVPGQREWFHRSPELVAHIEGLSRGIGDVRREASRLVKRALLGLSG